MKRNRKVTFYLSLFFGFTGVHYIYLGELIYFFAYLCMCLTVFLIPLAMIYSFFEAYYFYKMSDYHFDNKWNIEKVKGTETLDKLLNHIDEKVNN